MSIAHRQEASAELEKRSRMLPTEHASSGDTPVISAAFASKACDDLGIDRMLEELNKLMKTSYTLEKKGVMHQLQICLDAREDFGSAYGRLRPYWNTPSLFPKLDLLLSTYETEDNQMREMALDHETNRVIQPQTPPRRLWDLYSDRVLPWWVVQPKKEDVWVVSHSWREREYLRNETTPINGRKWPVPIPRDTTLEHVRQELLSYGAEYAWLDVLCLRQKGVPELEDVRREEWKLDVPTIGYIYKEQKNIMTYFCGLGLPFHTGDLDNKRHWLNRAWTFQEINANPFIGGLMKPEDSESAHKLEGVKQAHDGGGSHAFFDTLAEAIHFVSTEFDIFSVLKRMRPRHAESEMDKIAGLAYMLKSPHLPAYICDQDLEEAWIGLVNNMNAPYRAELFLLFSDRGAKRYAWLPCWEQIKTATKLPRPGQQGVSRKDGEYVSYRDGSYQFTGLRIKGCRIEGLGEKDPKGDCRQGSMLVRDGEGVEQRISVMAHHQTKIRDTHHHDYVLLGTNDCHYWVVGKEVEPGKFDKISVLRVESQDDQARIKKRSLVRRRVMNLI
ncbi:hypothetical protein EIP86_009812 [Pleurotus ostreatoroseus]|nr:hypothetical protein EIP86_009812 [Pleurotus ostreatoroseus]